MLFSICTMVPPFDISQVFQTSLQFMSHDESMIKQRLFVLTFVELFGKKENITGLSWQDLDHGSFCLLNADQASFLDLAELNISLQLHKRYLLASNVDHTCSCISPYIYAIFTI
ncbi:hypothetical protein RIF29_05895 [Crotalaria pallida]|uniref:Uncharacterized protein n=1 Tax=Crotalaria pallida TaxID=3830 RepID=A0AAN9J2V0_CROPI